jgi:hypothetical protein
VAAPVRYFGSGRPCVLNFERALRQTGISFPVVCPGEAEMSKTEGYYIVFRLPGGGTGRRITHEANEESAKAYIEKKYPNSKIVSCDGLDRAALAAEGLFESGSSREWISENTTPESNKEDG